MFPLRIHLFVAIVTGSLAEFSHSTVDPVRVSRTKPPPALTAGSKNNFVATAAEGPGGSLPLHKHVQDMHRHPRPHPGSNTARETHPSAVAGANMQGDSHRLPRNDAAVHAALTNVVANVVAGTGRAPQTGDHSPGGDNTVRKAQQNANSVRPRPSGRPCTGGEGGRWIDAVPGPLRLGAGPKYELDSAATRGHCVYKDWTVVDAYKQLQKSGGQQILFMGDSILRRVYETFWQKMLPRSTTVQVALYRPSRWPNDNHDDFIVEYDYGGPGIATQHLWAPYIRGRNENIKKDTRHVYSYEKMLRSLQMHAGRQPLGTGDKAPSPTFSDGVGVKVFDRELPALPWRGGKPQPLAELCIFGEENGSENNHKKKWERYCNPPSTVVINFGIWQTMEWEQNADALEQIMERMDSDNTGIKFIAVLPWPLRKVGSAVPASGIQEDPNVESHYKPEILLGMRKRFREICLAMRCCFVVDTWDAAYHRPQDAVDGRHYEASTPVVWTTLNLIMSAIEAPCPSR
jgi:hypothetical protein